MSALGLFYQEEGGRFLEYVESDEDEADLWENAQRPAHSKLAAFSHRLPTDTSVAAFSTTRSNEVGTETLNTYLLWQDEYGTIQMSWTDNNKGWKGPVSYPAFAGADDHTALACLTGLTFKTYPLQVGTELARCYFQTGLALREVSFDGDNWNIVGIVPIDF
ncbi:hypothetical protein N0V90_002978 [Kalmusia sp. IMI 367209]|nr:hypothetical protein N0V90_002978 [Kalmusia sp. IMI 367209]